MGWGDVVDTIAARHRTEGFAAARRAVPDEMIEAVPMYAGTDLSGLPAKLAVYAAAAARVLSIDGVPPDLDGPAGMERDAIRARRLGFAAKSTFNPRQVGVINQVFSPPAG